MCGILAILEDVVSEEYTRKLIKFVGRRGPDFKSDLLHHESPSGKKLVFYSSILHLRGDILQKQPLVNKDGDVLLFNGQIYQFAGQFLEDRVSDTCFLMQKLESCRTSCEVIQQLKLIDGPFAVVYWNNRLNTLIYGRDIFGRKSLCKLIDITSSDLISLSSVATQAADNPCYSWSEIDCDGLFAVEYEGSKIKCKSKYEWNYSFIYQPTEKCKLNIPEPNMRTTMIQCELIERLNKEIYPPSDFSEKEKSDSLNLLEKHLLDAVSLRIHQQIIDCLKCRKQTLEGHVCSHTKYAVAFSGGLDSTILALALDKLIDPDESIDLLTCSFKPDAPDRESVGLAFEELIRISPKRIWRLVICDINLEELVDMRRDIIRHLIWPCNTVIDDSLGCACWFIGRGRGRALVRLIDRDLIHLMRDFLRWNSQGPYSENLINSDLFNSDYYCPASMIFAGSSIDEQLGGYSSHRAAWSKNGATGLINEISFQMRRLPTRNLGRDDRIYSDHGRDLKLPYLDFRLVSYLNQLPVGLKMDSTLGLDSGSKMILRRLALRWGLTETGQRVKRAMQFGTKIAKLENSKEKGDDICTRLTDYHI